MKDSYPTTHKYRVDLKALIDEELRLTKALKNANALSGIPINFRSLKASNADQTIWLAEIQIPINMICPEDLIITNPAYINVADQIQISWDPSLNPPEFNDIDNKKCFNSFFGTVYKIEKDILYTSFKIPSQYWPPDFPNPNIQNAPKPPQIFYNINFFPNDSVYKRRMTSLEMLHTIPKVIKKAILGEFPDSIIQNDGKRLVTVDNLNRSQMDAVRIASSNPFTVIQGPPGCGKTYTIGAIAIACLNKNINQKVMICGTTNVSINSLLEICGNLLTRAGFKFCWVTPKSRDFETEEFITPEQKYTTFYQIMHMGTKESNTFYNYQKRIWNNEFVSGDERKEMETLRKTLETKVLKQSNVIFATLDSSVNNNMLYVNQKKKSNQVKSCLNIDTLIVDEATLSVEASLIIPLIHLPNRLILVGDQKQLGPPPTFQELVGKGFYRSLFERVIELGYQHTLLLNEQYRMHPDISRFSNIAFYGGLLMDAVRPEDRPINNAFTLQNHVNFINVNGLTTKVGTTMFNVAEANVVMNLVKALLSVGVPSDNIGVVSAYGAQASYLSMEMAKNRIRVKISTIDSFQGSQRDYIIITTARSGGTNLGFLNDERRMNVSITRARCFLAVVGNADTLSSNFYWSSFVDYCRENDWYIPNGESLTPRNLTLTQRRDQQWPKFAPRKIKSEFEEGQPGYSLSEIISPTSNTTIKILWPDNPHDIEYIKNWSAERLEVLNKGGFVTLAYDEKDVTLGFADIFDHQFNYLQWKNGDAIPTIKTNECIILSLYSRSGNDVKNFSLIEGMKPLLEHLNLLLLTFDFSSSLDALKPHCNISTKSILDFQLIYLPPKSSKEDLISSLGWKTLPQLLMGANEDPVNNSILQKAKERISKSSIKEFPFEENNFVIKIMKYPQICKFTKSFLEYASDDVFFIALLSIDILTKDSLSYILSTSALKLQKYNSYSSNGCTPSLVRTSHFLKENFTVIKQSYFSRETKLENLIPLYVQMSNLISIVDSKIPTINSSIIFIGEPDIKIIRDRFKQLEDILKSDNNLTQIKNKAILAPPPKFV